MYRHVYIYAIGCIWHQIQPIAFGVSFLQFQTSIEYLIFYVSLPRSVKKRQIPLSLGNLVESHFKCNRLYEKIERYNFGFEA